MLTAFLFSFFVVEMASADDVLIFYNNDASAAISRHDGALITHNSKLLVEEIKSFNPDLNVKLVPIANLREAADELQRSTEKVRGVVFVGHGNSQVFALNNESRGSGNDMAAVMSYLPQEKISSKLTVYFLGCEMAKVQLRENFQQEFYRSYLSILPQEKRSSVDVIAHSSMSAHKSFKEPNFIQKLAYRSGLGQLAEKITQSKGYVMPNLYFLMASTGVAALGGLDHASVTQVGAAALAAVFAKAYVESGNSRYGTHLSAGKTEVKNTVATLLATSFHADQCQAIFKTKSL